MDTPEFEKPEGVWCKDCVVGKGCGRYETRFPVCRDFKCLWLQSQDESVADDYRFGAEYRPDKSKVVLTKIKQGNVLAYVAPDRPDAWKTGPMGEWINRESFRQPVGIKCGSKIFMVQNGEVKK